MSEHRRIDVHQHLIPPFYAELLRAKGISDAGGRSLPSWSVEQALSLMDTYGITEAVLSVSTPGAHFGDDAEALPVSRELNEFSAAVCREQPAHFGFLASLPLPTVDGSVAQARYALDELGADGVVMLANSRGVYAGDPSLDPLMAELDRRAAVVFVHPAELPGDSATEGIPPFAADFLLDTTRAAYSLVSNGVITRHPNIRFLLAHAGGFVPYAAHRLSAAIVGDTGRDLHEVLDEFGSFYFDTALSSSPAALPSLLVFAAEDHVLFGSDWPFAPELAVALFSSYLDAYEALGDRARTSIECGAAERLFPRLARTGGG